MKTINKWMISSIACLFIFLVSCTKEQQTGTMTVKFANQGQQQYQFTDQVRSINALDAIFLDVKGCEMHYNDASYPDHWVALNTNAGIYNLFHLNNDASIVLVDELTMPAGEVGQMRLILGNNNTIVI